MLVGVKPKLLDREADLLIAGQDHSTAQLLDCSLVIAQQCQTAPDMANIAVALLRYVHHNGLCRIVP